MPIYLFDYAGFLYDIFETFADAYEALESGEWGDTSELFLTTCENPWKKLRKSC